MSGTLNSEEVDAIGVGVGTGSGENTSPREMRLRRRNRRHTSDDVIIIDSPLHAPSSRAPRRRRAALPNLDQTIVDLTCSSQDDIVDLTSPDLPPSPEIQILSDVKLISEDPSEVESDLNTSTERSSHVNITCPVCLETFSRIKRHGGTIMSTICGHVFCDKCIHQSVSMNKKCPTCRRKLTAKNVHPVYIPGI